MAIRTLTRKILIHLMILQSLTLRQPILSQLGAIITLSDDLAFQPFFSLVYILLHSPPAPAECFLPPLPMSLARRYAQIAE